MNNIQPEELIQITIPVETAERLCQACDLLVRLRLNQFDRLELVFPDESMRDIMKIDEFIRGLLHLRSSEQVSVRSSQVADADKQIYDLVTVIRHFLTKQRDPDSKMSVYASEPQKLSGKYNLPVVNFLDGKDYTKKD